MDDFREWLSDNLRYFMLGFGILAVVLIYFSVFVLFPQNSEIRKQPNRNRRHSRRRKHRLRRRKQKKHRQQPRNRKQHR